MLHVSRSIVLLMKWLSDKNPQPFLDSSMFFFLFVFQELPPNRACRSQRIAFLTPAVIEKSPAQTSPHQKRIQKRTSLAPFSTLWLPLPFCVPRLLLSALRHLQSVPGESISRCWNPPLSFCVLSIFLSRHILTLDSTCGGPWHRCYPPLQWWEVFPRTWCSKISCRFMSDSKLSRTCDKVARPQNSLVPPCLLAFPWPFFRAVWLEWSCSMEHLATRL